MKVHLNVSIISVDKHIFSFSNLNELIKSQININISQTNFWINICAVQLQAYIC